MQTIIETALGEFGTKEIPGDGDNRRIQEYFRLLNAEWDRMPDSTSWCCAFVKWVFKVHAIDLGDRLDARSLLDYGEAVEPKNFELGDVAVYWRGEHEFELIPGTSLKKGHVNFPVNKIGNYYYGLGGNQNNQVNVSAYPDFKLLGIRRIK